MSPAPGTRLGPYEVTAKLGEGGMGSVWRATDTNLGREVALKLLPDDFADDPERHARFEREAKLLASLNHPNIAVLHALEHLDGKHALVMELVEGEGLDELIARGPISVDEAIPIALQIAEALEAAHEHGIVHRDLKPANVRLRPDGTVKVLDFGLAKALGSPSSASGSGGAGAADLTRSPTLTSPALATVQGVILGTAAYMAPEQARGRPVDRRADVWAFGVMLWEMLTGRQLFTGETVSDLVAGVLRAEIPWPELPSSAPPALRRLLRRCLERDPRLRLRDMGDAALDLREAAAAPVDGAAAGSGPVHVRPPPASRALIATAASVTLVAVAVGVWALAHGGALSGSPRTSVSFELKTFDPQVVFNARFLPGERGIVYSAALTGNVPELFMLAPDAKAPEKLAGSGTHLLSVSADGELAVLTGARYVGHRVLVGTLARMTLDGSPRPLVEGVRDADWGPGGALAIVRRISGSDHLEYPIGTMLYETSGYVSEPRVSADGTLVAFLDHQWWMDDRGRIKVVDRSGHVRTVSEAFWAIEGLSWSADGKRLLFSGALDTPDLQARAATLEGSRSSRILAVPGSLTVLDVNHEGRWLATTSENLFGVVAHPPGASSDIDLTWLDSCWGPSLAPDGKTLLFTNGRGGPNYTVVTRRLDGSPITTLGEGDAHGFSPDGRWVAALIADPPSAVVYPTGAGAPRELDPGPIERYQNVQWFPDSATVLVSGSEPSRATRDYRQSIDGGAPEPVTPEGISGSLRPDGKAILALDEHDVWQLYPVTKGTPTPVPVLRPDDSVAAWSRDGTAVFLYHAGEAAAQIVRCDLATGERTPALTIAPEQRTGLVRVVFSSRVFEPGGGYTYGYLKDLSKLYVVRGVGR